MPPVVGLYAAPAALVFYAALGSSRQLITGPSAAAAALSAAVVGNAVAGNGDQFLATTAALAIGVGLAALVAGVLRLGFLANFISEPVLKGFIVGLALTIMVGQLPKLFGIESGTGDFFERAWDFLTNLDQTDGLTLLVGIGSLAILFGVPRVAPAIPGTLVAVVLGIGVVELFDLGDHGVAIVGSINSGLPSLGLPDVSLDRFGGMMAAALGVMLVGFAESLGTAKTFARRENQEIDANRELISLGAANLGAGISGGFAVTLAAVVIAALVDLMVSTDASAASSFHATQSPARLLLSRGSGSFLTGVGTDLPDTCAVVARNGSGHLFDLRGTHGIGWGAQMPVALRGKYRPDCGPNGGRACRPVNARRQLERGSAQFASGRAGRRACPS